MSIKQYYQCRLKKGTATTTAWIEKRGAKVGVSVELLPSKQLWQVTAVFDHGLPEDMLKEHQALHRNSLPSVEGMGR